MRERFAILALFVVGLFMFAAPGCSGEKKEDKKEEKAEGGKAKEKSANDESSTKKDAKAAAEDAKKQALAFLDKRKSDQTKVKLMVLQQASKSFQLKTGTTPKVLDDLHRLPAGMTKAKWSGPFLEFRGEDDFKDAWGNKVWIEPKKAKDGGAEIGIVVKSAGPNGKKGDDDDIEN